MLDIIERFGLDIIRPELQAAVYGGWLHNSLFLGLHYHRVSARRPAGPRDAEENTIYRFAIATGAFELPVLLLRAHEMSLMVQGCNGAVPQTSVMDLLLELNDTIAALKKWQLEEASFVPPHHRIVPISSPCLSRFNEVTGVCSPPFAFAYTFDDVKHAPAFRIMVCSTMKCQQAALALHRRLQRPLYAGASIVERDALKVHMQVLQREALATAESLCMLIPWSTQSRDMNVARVDVFRLLHEASSYYQNDTNGTQRHLHWCRTFRKALIQEYGTEVRFEV